MRIGRMIAAGTMAVGAYRAYKEYKEGHDGKSTSSRGRSTGRAGRRQQHRKDGWFGTPFSIRH